MNGTKRLVLVDTSYLLRLLVRLPEREGARGEAAQRLAIEDLCTTVSQLRECWAVLTRRVASNGYGLTVEVAREDLEDLAHIVRLTLDPPEAFAVWLDLCERTGTTGLHCHDAYLAACALALGAPILTRDRDFSRYAVSAA